jgi:Protein of unknown function (DUF2892)
MTANLGTGDKGVRFTAAIILAVLYFNGSLSRVWGAIALVVGAALLLTALLSYSPVYALFGLSSHPRTKR